MRVSPALHSVTSWQPQYVSGYTEIHYLRPWLPWHPLFRRLPEVVFDTPWRVPQGSTHFPLLLTVKDAHLYPVRLTGIKVDFAGPPASCYQLPGEYDCDTPWYHNIFQVPLPAGQHFIRCRVTFRLQSRMQTNSFINDNYPGRYRPFTIDVQRDASPQLPDCFTGELHYHSAASNDQVEFGAPLELLQTAMRALELDFAAVTDHSYDLVDRDEWTELRRELSELNRSDPAHLLLPAEEVSVRSTGGSNIHLLVLNDPRLLPGSGDSGRNLHRRSELSLDQVLAELHPEALAIAAHPASQPGWLERLLLRRSSWKREDYRKIRLLQAANGAGKRELSSALHHWIEQLQQGHAVYIVAGNDAHGDFNHSRRMGIPFVTVARSARYRAGWWRTGLFSERLEIVDLLESLARGRSFITEGPLLALEQKGIMMPARLDPAAPLSLHMVSNHDFGPIRDIRTHWGTIAGEESGCLVLDSQSQQEISLAIPAGTNWRYLRISGRTQFGHRFYSNPLFLSK
ncbi:MAG: CehA/McbA family metallohydrolase [Candidatus Delongbacteria bacterium]|nr:CehA/McbA family metallohydrolase [Candidatus Delongbacteria bacterium]